MTQLLFSILSVAYIAGIFLLAGSPMVSDVAPFNPYSLLHIPLYGILTILLILSNWSSIFINRGNPTNPTNPSNSINLFLSGTIALVVSIADEIHQAYLPNRNASVVDVFLDIMGIFLVIFLLPWERLQSYRVNKSLQASEAQRDKDGVK